MCEQRSSITWIAASIMLSTGANLLFFFQKTKTPYKSIKIEHKYKQKYKDYRWITTEIMDEDKEHEWRNKITYMKKQD